MQRQVAGPLLRSCSRSLPFHDESDAGALVRIPDITLPNAGVINAYLPNHAAPNPHTPEFLNLLKDTLAVL